MAHFPSTGVTNNTRPPFTGSLNTGDMVGRWNVLRTKLKEARNINLTILRDYLPVEVTLKSGRRVDLMSSFNPEDAIKLHTTESGTNCTYELVVGNSATSGRIIDASKGSNDIRTIYIKVQNDTPSRTYTIRVSSTMTLKQFCAELSGIRQRRAQSENQLLSRENFRLLFNLKVVNDSDMKFKELNDNRFYLALPKYASLPPSFEDFASDLRALASLGSSLHELDSGNPFSQPSAPPMVKVTSSSSGPTSSDPVPSEASGSDYDDAPPPYTPQGLGSDADAIVRERPPSYDSHGFRFREAPSGGFESIAGGHSQRQRSLSSRFRRVVTHNSLTRAAGKVAGSIFRGGRN